MRHVSLAFLPALLLACGSESAPSAETPEIAGATKASEEHNRQTPKDVDSPSAPANGKALPALADSPAMDLVTNRHLWHLYRDGLLLPLASEGMRKYNHEYSRPWKGNVTVDGIPGRVLSQRQSTLHFGWFDAVEEGEAMLRLHVHGLVAGQRLSVTLNGTSVGNLTLDAGWQDMKVSVPERVLKQGENELKLHVGKAGTVQGTKSYGLWHSIEVIPRVEGIAEVPALLLEPARRGASSLAGFARMSLLLEVPDASWFVFRTEGSGEFAATVVDVEGTAHVVHRGPAKQRERVSLAAYAGQLVRLDIASPPGGAWIDPRIVLETADMAPRPAPAQNAILLVVDALRSDHVPLYEPVYGQGSAVAMPNAEARAAKGSVVFLHNQAASPSSPPSHGSIQTGMIPRVHGVDGDRGQLRPGTPMISTQVRAAGISAGYYGNNPFGMGRLEAPGNWTEFHQPGQEGKSNDCTTLVEMMLDFARSQKAAGKRFFISALPYETHTPYRYHEGVTENYYEGPWPPPVGKNVGGELLGSIASGSTKLNAQQWKQLKGLYRGEAEYWDRCFGTLVTGLEESALLDDTAIILTSDHGEGMFEHGRMGHAFGHYRELGDVPFVVFWTALASGIRNIGTVTSHRDIAPTVLDILGIAPSEAIQGQSLVPLMQRGGNWTERVVSLEYGRSYSLRSKRYKLIADYNGRQEIYDLGLDPWETQDIKDSGSLAVRYLRDMAGFFMEYRSEWHYVDWGTLNNHGPGLLEAAEARAKAP